MLHRLSASMFIVAILVYFMKFIKFKKKNPYLKIHIITGTIGVIGMIIYSFSDYIKNRELSILIMGIMSFLILITGDKKIRTKYKYAHIICVVGFFISLSSHIIG